MKRIDIRVKTNLAAIAVYYNGDRKVEEKIKFRELSLSSGLVSGLSAAGKVTCAINMALPTNTTVELAAELLRRCNGSSVVRLFFPVKQAMTDLWNYLSKQSMMNGSCPYCGVEVHDSLDSCGWCGLSLAFDDSTYLDHHLHNTFTERVHERVNRCDQGMLQRLIALMDRSIVSHTPVAGNDEFVGTTPAIIEVFSMIRKAAATDMNILILGESGTGKELTAQAIHEKSSRKDHPLVVVNCAAIPEGLLEAELFGYEKGAFTGAYATKKGRFELADRGTIFLDEIGDLPAGLQSKLLRFLENHTIEHVGGKGGSKIDVRIIAATNCDLESMVEKTSFRKDLFFRLNSFCIKLPPLRERGEDKVVLAKHFFELIGASEQTCLQGFSPAALQAIRDYDWPGNVRELINKVRRGFVMATTDYIEPADMELNLSSAECRPIKLDKAADPRQVIIETLQRHNHCIAKTARSLGISRPTVYALLRKHHISECGASPTA